MTNVSVRVDERVSTQLYARSRRHVNSYVRLQPRDAVHWQTFVEVHPRLRVSVWGQVWDQLDEDIDD